MREKRQKYKQLLHSALLPLCDRNLEPIGEAAYPFIVQFVKDKGYTQLQRLAIERVLEFD